jgi:hypothetical protein
MEEQGTDLVESYVLNLFNFCNEFLNQQKRTFRKFS